MSPCAKIKSHPVLLPDKNFERCIIRTVQKDGFSITCRLGLWSVSSHDLATAEREARHYWVQYRADGEYSKLLTST